MARTPTHQIPLGFKAIEFDLPDVITGEKVSLNQVSKKNGLVVIFICNHCPYVVHVLPASKVLSTVSVSPGAYPEP